MWASKLTNEHETFPPLFIEPHLDSAKCTGQDMIRTPSTVPLQYERIVSPPGHVKLFQEGCPDMQVALNTVAFPIRPSEVNPNSLDSIGRLFLSFTNMLQEPDSHTALSYWKANASDLMLLD